MIRDVMYARSFLQQKDKGILAVLIIGYRCQTIRIKCWILNFFNRRKYKKNQILI
jgi:hypothetical protein